MAVQTQRLTLDIVGLTAFSHDFGECDAIARWVGREGRALEVGVGWVLGRGGGGGGWVGW